MPSISVILPFHNPGDLFSRAIESIKSQSFCDWELLLINNASDARSEKTAKQYAHHDHRIKVIDERKKGIVFALNAGLVHASGEFIARMDADDISLPDRFELQHNYLKNNPEVDLCAGKVQHISANNDNTQGFLHYTNWINSLLNPVDIALYQFIESPLSHPSVMFRRTCVEKWGDYKNGDFPEDYELWLRWLSKGAKMSKISQEVLIWQDQPDRLSRTDQRYHPDAFFNVKLPYIDQWIKMNNPFYPDIVIWGAGKIARKRARRFSELGYNILYHIDIDPKKARAIDCIYYKEIEEPGRFFILSLAGSRGAAGFVESFLSGKGFINGKDFLLAAGF